MKKIAVVTPIYIDTEEHLDLAKATMASVQADDVLLETIGVVNQVREGADGRRDWQWIDNSFDIVFENDQNILSRAWNRGILSALARGAEYAVVINLDLLLHPKCIDSLVAFADSNKEYICWSGAMVDQLDALFDPTRSTKTKVSDDCHFSCFMVDNRLLEIVGGFDEQFVPIYHEDSDMRRRIKLAGERYCQVESALFYHLENGTMKCYVAADNEPLAIEYQRMTDENLVRYVKKWGGRPYEEQFKTPYNLPFGRTNSK